MHTDPRYRSCDAIIKPTPIGMSHQVASLPQCVPMASSTPDRADALVDIRAAHVPSNKKRRRRRPPARRRATALASSELPDGDSQRASQVAWYEERAAEERAEERAAEGRAGPCDDADGGVADGAQRSPEVCDAAGSSTSERSEAPRDRNAPRLAVGERTAEVEEEEEQEAWDEEEEQDCVESSEDDDDDGSEEWLPWKHGRSR